MVAIRLDQHLDRHTEERGRRPGVGALLHQPGRCCVAEDAVDVAIRLGRQIDSSATAKLITMIPRVILVAPAYLERYGMPEKPADLAAHRIVAGPASAVPHAWTFERDGGTVAVDLQPHFSTNENEGAVERVWRGADIV